MKRIGILYHPMKDEASALAKKLEGVLSGQGLSGWLYSAWEWEKAREQVEGTDLVLSIGGDGTILRAAQAVLPSLTPITGINLGKLGFMTELNVDEVMGKLPALLAGKGHIDERALLEAELYPTGEEQKPSQKFYALNDVVVTRGAIARMIYIDTSIDGELLTTYKADGVIVATATGSTGYALAAGGPVLHPQARDFVLIPILPHLSSGYAMVLPSNAVVKLKLSTVNPATLSIDGHINISISSGATIVVRHSTSTVRFLRIHKTSCYGSLEQRLKGKH
jgi:NAD+ kinase